MFYECDYCCTIWNTKQDKGRHIEEMHKDRDGNIIKSTIVDKDNLAISLADRKRLYRSWLDQKQKIENWTELRALIDSAVNHSDLDALDAGIGNLPNLDR